MEARYLTIEQVAVHYQVSVSTVRVWIRQKLVPALKVGGMYRLKIAELDAAFKELAANASPAKEQQITAVIAPAQAAVLNPDQDI
jgi:excisionase family DNA binding protein